MIEHIEGIIQHMKELGFKRFLVSEPPVASIVPLLKRVLNWGVFDLEGLKITQSKFQEQFADLQKRHGDAVVIFPEISLLEGMSGKTHLEDDFLDIMHAGQLVHNELAEAAQVLIKQAGWDVWNRLSSPDNGPNQDAVPATTHDPDGFMWISGEIFAIVALLLLVTLFVFWFCRTDENLDDEDDDDDADDKEIHDLPEDEP